MVINHAALLKAVRDHNPTGEGLSRPDRLQIAERRPRPSGMSLLPLWSQNHLLKEIKGELRIVAGIFFRALREHREVVCASRSNHYRSTVMRGAFSCQRVSNVYASGID